MCGQPTSNHNSRSAPELRSIPGGDTGHGSMGLGDGVGCASLGQNGLPVVEGGSAKGEGSLSQQPPRLIHSRIYISGSLYAKDERTLCKLVVNLCCYAIYIYIELCN